MLKALTVQSLVVVRHVDIEFAPGLTVLSGETGAGKSVLIDALGLALGERADSKLVRAGDERATVTAAFDIANVPAAQALLRAHALDSDNECVLRRVVMRDGGSRAFCNASPIPVQLMHEIGECLVDIHAQHASLQVLKRDVQRELLDAYGEHEQALVPVRAAHARWREAEQQLVALDRATTERDRVELLRYQLDELEQARFDEAEIANLESEHKRLANAATNLEQLGALRALLGDDEEGALARLQRAVGRAEQLARRSDDASGLVELVNQGLVCVEEALSELERVEGATEIDPGRLARLDDRISELHTLARKHQVSVTELPAVQARLAGELHTFDQSAAARAKLDAERAAALVAYAAACTGLTQARRKAAKRMNTEITRRLRELGLPHAQFACAVDPSGEATPQAHGADRVEFTIATNPDQPAGPLNKVASGGELSRIALAIQAATVRHAGIPVVVFDEVDTGIGGTTATTVGRTLRDVASERQIICITHSPQVASAGEHHLLVSKHVHQGATETRLTALDRTEREREIARMLGAAEATAASVAHARDLIAAAGKG